MRRWISKLTLVVLALAGASLIAQEKKAPEKKPPEKTTKTPAQAAQAADEKAAPDKKSAAEKKAKFDEKAGTNEKAGPDEKAIRATADAFIKAFESGDAKAVAALWTVDCDYIDENGQAFHGREAIENEYAELFSAHQGLKLQLAIASIRLIGSEAAVEDGTSNVHADAGAISSRRYTAVHVKQKGKWLIASVRDMADAAESADESQQTDGLADLESFVGDWVTERDGTTVRTTCQWMFGKKFLQRTYTATDNDQQVSSGVQIIGWDPSSRSVRSWTFDSTGGFAQGLWSETEGGWVIDSDGVLADGTLTTSNEILHIVDRDVVGWQSINRSLGGEPIPDTEEVVLERVKDTKTNR